MGSAGKIELRHPGGTHSRATAAPHLKEPMEVVPASGKETSELTQDMLEGLYIASRMGMLWDSSQRAGGSVRGEISLGFRFRQDSYFPLTLNLILCKNQSRNVLPDWQIDLREIIRFFSLLL